MMADCWV
jgi:hypothetical protein